MNCKTTAVLLIALGIALTGCPKEDQEARAKAAKRSSAPNRRWDASRRSSTRKTQALRDITT